tara:strand:- start:6042 stop:8012 length:1971 start_codon:yes stop_codon:yes gene_type:complete
MNKNILLSIFLYSFFIFNIVYASEIIRLDDGRIVNLNEDGTFTIIKESEKITYCLDGDGVYKYIVDACYDGQIEITEEEYNILRDDEDDSSNYITVKPKNKYCKTQDDEPYEINDNCKRGDTWITEYEYNKLKKEGTKNKYITKKKELIYCKDSDGVFKYIIDTCYDGQVEITEEEYNRLQNNSSSTYITKKSDEEEKSIINFLNVFDLNYRTINFLENSTIVQLLDVEFEDIIIEELIIEKPNSRYLNYFNTDTYNPAKDKYQGQFFEKLIIKKLSSLNNSGLFDLSIDYLEMKRLDLKELGLLKQLAIGEIDENINNISAILDSLSLKSLILNKVSFKNGIDEYYYDSIILNNLKNSSLGELIYKDGIIIGKDDYVEIGLTEIKNLKFNSPKKYINEFDYFEHPREAFLFFESLASMKIEDYYQEIYELNEKIIIKIDDSEIKNVRTKKIDNLSIPVSFNHTTNGLSISSDTNDDINYLLTALGYSEFKFDYSIDINWNPGSEILSFNFLVGIQEGADLEIDVKFDDIDFVKLINDSFSPYISNYVQSEPKIKSISVTLIDKGLTLKLLDVYADEMQMNTNQAITFLVNQLEDYAVFVESPLTYKFIYSLQDFLQNPDKLSFLIDPAVPLSYNDINSLIANPGLLVELLNMKFE